MSESLPSVVSHLACQGVPLVFEKSPNLDMYIAGKKDWWDIYIARERLGGIYSLDMYIAT